MLSIKEILEKLYETSAPSGFEGETAKVISGIAESLGLSHRTDALGNLIVHRPGEGKRVILDAHMDTIGFLATYIDDKGFVRFDSLGGISACDMHNVPVRFLNGTRGVVSYEQKVDVKERKTSSMYIDIGAKNKEDAKKLVLPGDAACFEGGMRELSGGRICAPYLDNRLGCAIVLYALAQLEKCEYDVYAVFSVQEEVGCRGAKTAAYAINADFAIVLDVTDSCDTPGFDGYGETRMSEGVAIKIMDATAVCHPAVTSSLIDVAEKNSIPYQRDVITAGGTDAGNISLSRGGIPSGGISVPVRYIHTPCEVADMSDIEAAAKLLVCALETKSVIL